MDTYNSGSKDCHPYNCATDNVNLTARKPFHNDVHLTKQCESLGDSAMKRVEVTLRFK